MEKQQDFKKYKEAKIERLSKDIEFESNQLATAEGKYNLLIGKPGKEVILEKIKSAIDKHKENIRRLKFEMDALGSEKIDSINGIKGKRVKFTNEINGNGNASFINKGESLDDLLREDMRVGSEIDGEEIALRKEKDREEELRTGKKSFREALKVKNIGKCEDGSYLVETEASVYRLNIEEEEDDDMSGQNPGQGANSQPNNNNDIPNVDYSDLDEEWKNKEGELEKNRKAKKDKLEEDEMNELGDQELADRMAENADDEEFNNFNKEENEYSEMLDKLIAENPEIDRILSTRPLSDKNAEIPYNNANIKDKILMILGEKSDISRRQYAEKDYELNKVSKSFLNIFRKNVNLGNHQKDLDDSKDGYRQSLQEYLAAVLQIEGVSGDRQEQEIMMRYLKVSESLNLQEDRLDVLAEKEPKLQWVKDHMGKIGMGYLKTYKKSSTFLSEKFSNFVSEKTDSKALKFLGSVGGGVAFGVGLSSLLKTTGAPYWATKAFLMATSIGLSTVGNKEKLDEEYIQKKKEVMESDIYIKLEKISSKTDVELDESMKILLNEELGTSVKSFEDRSEEIANRERWTKAFKKGIMKSAFWYAAGRGLAGAFELGENWEEIKNNIHEITGKLGGASGAKVSLESVDIDGSSDYSAREVESGSGNHDVSELKKEPLVVPDPNKPPIAGINGISQEPYEPWKDGEMSQGTSNLSSSTENGMSYGENKAESIDDLWKEKNITPVTGEFDNIDEKIGYQGGKSVWGEAEKQLGVRMGGVFNGLGGGDAKLAEALQTHNIDRLKDAIVADPEKYGLPKGINFNKMSVDQLKGIKWNDAFKDVFGASKLTENLSSEQVNGIVGNNEALREALKAKGFDFGSHNPNLMQDFKEGWTPSGPQNFVEETDGSAAARVAQEVAGENDYEKFLEEGRGEIQKVITERQAIYEKYPRFAEIKDFDGEMLKLQKEIDAGQWAAVDGADVGSSVQDNIKELNRLKELKGAYEKAYFNTYNAFVDAKN